MIPEARDFLAESEALHSLITEQTDRSLVEQTAFKGWTLNEIIRHLHVWNQMACHSLNDQTAFDKAFQQLLGKMGDDGLRPCESDYLDGLSGADLLAQWLAYCGELASAFDAVDPEQRVPWAGPPMSARSSVVARLMETWSHAQAIYDALGVERVNSDRVRSIAELGVRTYSWTFVNRQQQAPRPKPHVRLTAPSGAIWEWNEERADERVEGDAVEFCQVVTQSRNIADTGLAVTGENAAQWMSIAQCFAGGAETPPLPGARSRET